jgi:transcriptional regulator with XRE-family HTH domain
MRDKIKALLKKEGWSQKRLSEELNVSIAAVKSWTLVTGHKTPNKWIQPTLEKIFKEAGIS